MIHTLANRKIPERALRHRKPRLRALLGSDDPEFSPDRHSARSYLRHVTEDPSLPSVPSLPSPESP